MSKPSSASSEVGLYGDLSAVLRISQQLTYQAVKKLVKAVVKGR